MIPPLHSSGNISTLGCCFGTIKLSGNLQWKILQWYMLRISRLISSTSFSLSDRQWHELPCRVFSSWVRRLWCAMERSASVSATTSSLQFQNTIISQPSTCYISTSPHPTLSCRVSTAQDHQCANLREGGTGMVVNCLASRVVGWLLGGGVA